MKTIITNILIVLAMPLIASAIVLLATVWLLLTFACIDKIGRWLEPLSCLR